MLLDAWKKELKTRKIPFSLNLNLIDMLTDAATVRAVCSVLAEAGIHNMSSSNSSR